MVKCAIIGCGKEAKWTWGDDNDPNYFFCGYRCAMVWLKGELLPIRREK